MHTQSWLLHFSSDGVIRTYKAIVSKVSKDSIQSSFAYKEGLKFPIQRAQCLLAFSNLTEAKSEGQQLHHAKVCRGPQALQRDRVAIGGNPKQWQVPAESQQLLLSK